MGGIWNMGYEEMCDMSRMEKRPWIQKLSLWTQAYLHPKEIGGTIRRVAKYTVYGWLYMISLVGAMILGLVIGLSILGSWLSGILFGK
jgi:hypothetical protein